MPNLGTTVYTSVVWTNGDIISEAKMDNMVANDQAYDAHAAEGILLNNAFALAGKSSGGSNYNLARVDSTDYMELGEAGLEGMEFLLKRNEPIYNIGNSGATKTISWKNGSCQKMSLTASCTLTFTNTKEGDVLALRVANTGAYTITWPATTRAPEGAIDVTSGAGVFDWYFFKCVATNEFELLGQVNNLTAV